MRFWTFFGMAALALVTMTGCGGALAFNQSIVKANQDLQEAGKKFGEALTKALTDQSQIPALDTSYKEMLQRVDDVAARMKKLKVPQSDSAKALYEQHQRFLASQKKMCVRDFGELVKALKDQNMDPGQKNNKVQEILLRVQKEEATELQLLQSAQRKFASDHKLKLK